MGNFINLSDKQATQIQDKIEVYRDSFFHRSSGTALPEINYLGKFEKSPSNSFVEEFFVSMPIKNQEIIIIDILQTLLTSINQNFTLGLLFDNCSDKSLKVCMDFFSDYFDKFHNLSTVHFLQSNGELFESTYENILFLLCTQKYFVSIQADNFFTDKTFLERSVLAFSKLPRLFVISGKAIVSFKILSSLKVNANKILHSYDYFINFGVKGVHKKKLGFYVPALGYFGDRANPPSSYMQFKTRQLNTLYLGEAVIRGPVIWLSEVFRKFGGFNDIAFTLGRDDCDLSFRAFHEGYVAGYLPCSAFSVYEHGTTRKKRSQKDQIELDNRLALSKNNPSTLMKFWRDELSPSFMDTLHINKVVNRKNYGKSIFLLDKSFFSNFSNFFRLKNFK